MGETPDDIRNEIEDTRGRMGDTVEAIGYKADVKSRVKESVAEKKDSLVGSISGGKDAVVGKADSLVSRVGGVVPDGEQVKDGAAKVGVSKENPLGLALAGAAVGFVVGTLLPETDGREREAGRDLRPGHGHDERGRSGSTRAREVRCTGRRPGREPNRQERGKQEADALQKSVAEKADDATRAN